MQIVEPSFDENVLRALCDMDNSSVCCSTAFGSNKAKSRLLSGGSRILQKARRARRGIWSKYAETGEAFFSRIRHE